MLEVGNRGDGIPGTELGPQDLGNFIWFGLPDMSWTVDTCVDIHIDRYGHSSRFGNQPQFFCYLENSSKR